MKKFFQLTAMVCGLALAGLTVVNVPLSRDQTGVARLLALAPEITVTPLQAPARDRLDTGRVAQE